MPVVGTDDEKDHSKVVSDGPKGPKGMEIKESIPMKPLPGMLAFVPAARFNYRILKPSCMPHWPHHMFNINTFQFFYSTYSRLNVIALFY